MDYKKMIIAEHLVNNFLNKELIKQNKAKKQMVFNLNGELYTGRFIDIDSEGRTYGITRRAYEGFESTRQYFSDKNLNDTSQAIRSAFYNRIFRNLDDHTVSDYKTCFNYPEFIFYEIVEFVKTFDEKVINPNVILTFCIYDLTKYGTDETLPFYKVSDVDNITPVSLVDIIE